MSACCVYILYSESLDKYYVGSTENIDLRLHIHNNPMEARKFTAKGIPWTLKLKMDCDNKSIALKAERSIKSMKSRKFIERLLEQEDFRVKFLQSVST